MSMSFADSFRTLQAVRDLRILAALAPVEARARIAAGIPTASIAPDMAQMALEALTQGNGLAPDVRDETIKSVQTQAALPNEDYPTFLLASFLLLIEVLSGRTPYLEIEHHWPTFREHYRAAAAVERAAIGQAFRRISTTQEIEIPRPEIRADRTTASAAALNQLLEPRVGRALAPLAPTHPSSVASVLIDAMSDPAAVKLAADLWAENGTRFSNSMPEEIIAGFRHIYEAWDGFAPNGAPLIPLLDPPPGVDWPY